MGNENTSDKGKVDDTWEMKPGQTKEEGCVW
jgi:hypothetical protein